MRFRNLVAAYRDRVKPKRPFGPQRQSGSCDLSVGLRHLARHGTQNRHNANMVDEDVHAAAEQRRRGSVAPGAKISGGAALCRGVMRNGERASATGSARW
jgi:hypothetical protein